MCSVHTVPSVRGFPTRSIPYQANQLKSLRKPQHPGTGHLLAFDLGLRLGFESGGHITCCSFFARRPSKLYIFVQQYISDTCCETLRTFLQDSYDPNIGNTSGFRSEPFRLTPSVPPPLSLRALSPVFRGTRPRSPCVARAFPLGSGASMPSIKADTYMHVPSRNR